MESTKSDSPHAAENLIESQPDKMTQISAYIEAVSTTTEHRLSGEALVLAVEGGEERLREINPDMTDMRRHFGWRHVQAFMAFLALTMAYIYRTNLSVAIVAMTEEKYRGPTYKWDSKDKSKILTAFFWGYLWLQLVLGNVADRYGSKYIFIAAILVSSVTNLLTVFVADWGVVAMMILRIVHGFSQGAIYPCLTVLISKWIPPVERGPILTFVFIGANVGTIVGLLLSGFLASSEMGWPLIFYVTSAMGPLWAFVFFWIGASTPSSHVLISRKERQHIETSQKVDTAKRGKKLKTPWKRILLSLPVWALIVVHLGQNWGYWTLLTHLPNFMDKVLKFDIKQNGLLSALPYFVGWITAILFSWIAFAVQRETSISKTLHRKIWTTIAFWGDAAALVCLGVINLTDVTVVIVILVSTLALNSGIFSGFITSQLDLTPNFAGTIMGLENSISSITSLVGPLVVGYIVTNETSPEEWKHVFILSAVIMFLTNLFYLVFGSAETQSWNEAEEENPTTTPIQSAERWINEDTPAFHHFRYMD